MNQDVISRLKTITEKLTPESNLEELLEELMIFSSKISTRSESEPVALKDLISKATEYIFNQAAYTENSIPLGFPDLDLLTNGLIPGELVIIGSRPGMGKSQLLVQLCQQVARNGRSTAYFSLEMSSNLVLLRMIASLVKISASSLITGRIGQDRIQEVRNAIELISGLPIVIDDNAGYNVYYIKEKCRKLVRNNGVRVIFVDTIQMISGINRRHHRENDLSIICRELKSIARELDVVVIATSQLSRRSEARGGNMIPVLSDLRDSGAIEQDADKVFFLYRPEYYAINQDVDGNSTRGLSEVIVAKNRNGAVGTVKLIYDNNLCSFDNFDGYLDAVSISGSRMSDFDN